MSTATVKPQVGYTNSLIVNLVFDNGLAADNLVVNAYSVGFGASGTTLQGSASSSTDGNYVIVYNPSTTPINLQVRVLGTDQQEVTISKTLYNAGIRETMNLVVPANVVTLGAEYDRLSADMTTQVGAVAKLAGAEEGADRQDLSLFYQTTNWDARPLAVLATTGQHPAVGSLGEDAVYALLRHGPSEQSRRAGNGSLAHDRGCPYEGSAL